MNLPDKRKDGMCCDCLEKLAETNDGRFCLRCLRARIRHANPMTGCYKGMYRTSGHKEAGQNEDNPSVENGVRHLEEDR